MPQQPISSLPVREFTVRVSPLARGAQHAPRVVSQKSLPPAQLEASEHVVRQAVAPQMKGVQSVVPALGQLPMPSQTLALVCVVPLQLCCPVPQLTVVSGNTQSPLRASQSVAPQGAVTLVQAAVQQWPVPLMPQTPEVQASLVEQAPVASLAAHAPALQ